MRDLVKHDSQSLTLHALGQLSETDAVALEAHLVTCAECTREWKEVRDITALLDEHVPDEAFLDALTDTARADPNDLVFEGRILPAVRREKRAEARHRLLRPLAAAAAVVLVALAGAVAVGRASAPEPPPTILQVAGARTVHGTGVGGATLQATVAPAQTGDTVELLVNAAGLPRGAHCQLYVVTTDGTRELAGSWTVPAGGPIQGSAAVNMSQVQAVAVTNADTGQELAYLQV